MWARGAGLGWACTPQHQSLGQCPGATTTNSTERAALTVDIYSPTSRRLEVQEQGVAGLVPSEASLLGV